VSSRYQLMAGIRGRCSPGTLARLTMPTTFLHEFRPGLYAWNGPQHDWKARQRRHSQPHGYSETPNLKTSHSRFTAAT